MSSRLLTLLTNSKPIHTSITDDQYDQIEDAIRDYSTPDKDCSLLNVGDKWTVGTRFVEVVEKKIFRMGVNIITIGLGDVATNKPDYTDWDDDVFAERIKCMAEDYPGHLYEVIQPICPHDAKGIILTTIDGVMSVYLSNVSN